MHRAESDGLSALAFNFCFLFLRENLNLHWLLLDDDRDECIAPRVIDSQRLLLIFVFLFLRENLNLHSLLLDDDIEMNASRRE